MGPMGNLTAHQSLFKRTVHQVCRDHIGGGLITNRLDTQPNDQARKINPGFFYAPIGTNPRWPAHHAITPRSGHAAPSHHANSTPRHHSAPLRLIDSTTLVQSSKYNRNAADSLAWCCECDPSTIRRWARNGTMPKPLKIGGRVLWDAEEIRQWIRQGCPRCD